MHRYEGVMDLGCTHYDGVRVRCVSPEDRAYLIHGVL